MTFATRYVTIQEIVATNFSVCSPFLSLSRPAGISSRPPIFVTVRGCQTSDVNNNRPTFERETTVRYQTHLNQSSLEQASRKLCPPNMQRPVLRVHLHHDWSPYRITPKERIHDRGFRLNIVARRLAPVEEDADEMSTFGRERFLGELDGTFLRNAMK